MQNVMKKKSFIYVVGAVVVIGAAALIFRGMGCSCECNTADKRVQRLLYGREQPRFEIHKSDLERLHTICDLVQITPSDCEEIEFSHFVVWAIVEGADTLIVREESSQSAELTPQQKELIAQAGVGSRIGISDIKVKTEDGSEKEVPDYAIKVRE
jgi:hypothetical protein